MKLHHFLELHRDSLSKQSGYKICEQSDGDSL